MNYPLSKLFLLVLLINFFGISLLGQVTGQLNYLPTEEKYLISVVPNQTLTAPNNITNTGQITLKATAGSFNITNVLSFNGVWSKTATIKSPIESPDFDYHIFILNTHIDNPSIEAGVELPLFSFNNSGDCEGSIELIDNFTDEFLPPNSRDANIGNQLSILGFGFDNAYISNDELAYKIECPKELNLQLTLDTIKCATDSTTLSIEVLNGVLPFIYSLSLENGHQVNDSITQLDIVNHHKVPLGNHIINGYDQFSVFTDSLLIESPLPLRIEILERTNISCHSSTGAIHVQGFGGLAENRFQYNWSNNENGNQLSGLNSGFYTVTMTDAYNCSAIKTIVIETQAIIRIDSVDMHPPTCDYTNDGIIEMVSISNGELPFQFKINNKPYQNENYFDNLAGGTHQVFVTDANNCVTSKRVVLNNPEEIVINTVQKDTYLLKGERIHLIPEIQYSGSLFYNWSPNHLISCTECPNPIVQPVETTTYTLTVSDSMGCEGRMENNILVLENTPIYIPNIFRPTANSENRDLKVFIGPTIHQIQKFQIFNRWGQLIYSVPKATPGQNVAWNGYYNGNLAESGIYIYLVEVLLKNNKTEIHSGDFFLKR